MTKSTGLQPAPNWRRTLKERTVVAACLFGCWTVGIEARLVYLQVFKRADLGARAARQQMRTIVAPAARGDILDRHGRVLATSADADSIYAVPTDVDNPSDVVRKLCSALRDCPEKERQALMERLSRQKPFAFVRRQVSPDEARRVAALNLDGIGFLKESRRFYPNKELAAHLLGYVGIDNDGLNGVESAFDSQIRGKPGTVLIQTDARRHAFSRFERPPTSGSTVELTVDEYLQHVAERELHEGVLENHAAGGSTVLVNPRTGEILALANEPTFNPNAYRDASETNRRNRAVQDLYEPGSTFKIVTASAAIQERVMPIESWIDTNPGQIKIPGRPAIREDAGRNYGVLSFTDVIVKSSNIGAIRIGFKVGTDRLSDYIQRFGFGHPVSRDFPGESPGIVWDRAKWTESALASVSMGYQIGVTPIQMAAAVSSVANGGELIEPHIVRALYRDNRRYEVKPKPVRRTINLDTAAALTTIMEQVVERGTARRAQIPGYTIAGKTGTATKLINGHYSRSDYYASFVGFLPSRNPVLAMIVVIDSPHGPNGFHGGSVSAPIFKRIASAALTYLGIPPTLNPEPPVLVARQDQTGTTPTTTAASADPVMSLVAEGPPGTVPDLRGLSARAAVRTLVSIGLTARISGDGFVVSQEPEPGAAAEPNGVCRLVLDRAPSRHSAGASQP